MFKHSSKSHQLWRALWRRPVPGYECPRELRTQSNGTIFVDDFAFSDQHCRKVKCPLKVPRAQDFQGSGAALVPRLLCQACLSSCAQVANETKLHGDTWPELCGPGAYGQVPRRKLRVAAMGERSGFGEGLCAQREAAGDPLAGPSEQPLGVGHKRVASSHDVCSQTQSGRII